GPVAGGDPPPPQAGLRDSRSRLAARAPAAALRGRGPGNTEPARRPHRPPDRRRTLPASPERPGPARGDALGTAGAQRLGRPLPAAEPLSGGQMTGPSLAGAACSPSVPAGKSRIRVRFPRRFTLRGIGRIMPVVGVGAASQEVRAVPPAG